MERISRIAALWLVLLALGGCESRRQMAQNLERASRGAEIYRRMCAVCHGADGQGYAADRAPRLNGREFLASVSDDALRAAIASGRSGTTMSAWGKAQGGPLGPGELDVLVAFMRLWRRPGASPVLDERPLEGDADRGAEIYERECKRCHGAEGTSGPEVHIGSSHFLSTVSNGYLRYAIAGGRSRTPMPSFASSLGPRGIDDVIALLRKWQSASPPLPRPVGAKPPPLPLGQVPLNPRGREPTGFRPGTTTPADVVKAALSQGARMAFLDARAPSDYINEHIAGAVSVPFYDPAPYLPRLPKDVWYVCYCACPHAESGQLAAKLGAAGYKKVTILDEGIGVWHARGYGTRTGLDP
jgi:mono/diheme cytochrome c family protein/rhodanese-related sulfurtransferase